MKLVLVRYVCANCGSSFKAPELNPTSYGEFLLRSGTTGSLAYLDALGDSTYDEVEAILSENPLVQRRTATGRADLLRRIYGPVACDPDETGNPFVIGMHPVCPICRSQSMKEWETAEPLETVNIVISPVHHSTWNQLTTAQKGKRVSASLMDILTV